jgi:predicted RNase H-like HicB family nuclease
MAEVRLILRALIYRDDDCWVAHCLETDVVADGDTPMQAFENLQSLTALQIETAMEEGDLQSIFRQAPSEILSLFAVGQDRQIRRRPPASVERFDVRTLQPN